MNDHARLNELDARHPPGTKANAAGRLSIVCNIAPQHAGPHSPFEPWIAVQQANRHRLPQALR